MPPQLTHLAAALLLLTLTRLTHAQTPAPFESPTLTLDPLPATLLANTPHTLLNPTPPNQRRDFAPGRPGKTPTPTTIDPGALQLESSFASYLYDRQNSQHPHAQSLQLATSTLRVGLTESLELDLTAFPYNFAWVNDSPPNPATTHQGYGDTLISLPYNFTGNNPRQNPFALGLIPFLKIPTNQDQLGNPYLEGGLALPMSLQLQNKWAIGANLEIDATRRPDNSGYFANFIASVYVEHPITGQLFWYLEFYNALSTSSRPGYLATLDLALFFPLTNNIQLDLGLNLALTKPADTLNPYLGITIRF